MMKRLLLMALLLGLVVVPLGAYVRLSDAGLGCPDWPGCYGHMVLPAGEKAQQAASAYPDRPLEPHKAWKEMIHRYVAGTLGLLVLAIAVVAWRARRQRPVEARLGLLLLGVIVFQALLGMWTVTLKLKPLIVMGHLLGGLTTISLILALLLLHRGQPLFGQMAWQPRDRNLARMALIGLLLLVAQIALGGWTSANYAALACPDFPQCQSQWWPAMDFREAFVLWRGIGINYEFGILDSPARTAIHMSHRMGAVVVALYLAWLAMRLLWAGSIGARRLGLGLLLLLLLQLSLGISNVVFHLPLPVAVAHNAGAALLLLMLVTINLMLWRLPATEAEGAPIRGGVQCPP
ncbi:MAG: heme A synthase [Gammaproteobacteria bacterium]|nr:MAG: heme A synthase [Gammaproteobacteria bacterium]